MVLIESALHILYRVKFTYYLPNKQLWELNTLMTFMSLWAGCTDHWLCWIYAILLFLPPFISVRNGVATTLGSLPNCLNVRCKAFAKTGNTFSGEQEHCRLWYNRILTESGSIGEVQRAPCWWSAACCHKEIAVWDYADLGTCLPSGSWSYWHWEAWKQRKGL